MRPAGDHTALAPSVRARIGAALGALALHVLAVGAALWLEGAPADSGTPHARHVTVIALEPARTAFRPPAMPTPRLAVAAPGVGRVAALQDAPAIGASAVPATATPPRAVDAAKPAIVAAPTAPASVPADTGAAAAAYARRLWLHIAAQRPRGAGMSGTSLIGFRLTSSGALVSAEVVRSSGNFNLDRIALRTVRQAAPMPPPPDGLGGDQLRFTVPVEFH